MKLNMISIINRTTDNKPNDLKLRLMRFLG